MSNEMINYEEYMRKTALEAVETEKSTAALTFFSTQGGILTWQNAPIANNKMPVIVLDFLLENTYYESAYNPEAVRSPICYALGRSEIELKPHEQVDQPQHPQCVGCRQYEWGSDGKGKVCKSKRRLAVISAATLDPQKPEGYDFDLSVDHFEKAEIGGLRVPVTSGTAWGRYVKKIEATYRRPPFGMVTMVEVKPDKKTQLRLEFNDLFPVKKELLPVIIERHKEARGLLDFPFAPNAETPQAPQQPKKSRKY